MLQPIANCAVGRTLQCHLDDSWIATVQAAEQVNRICNVPPGVRTGGLEQRQQVRMPRATVGRDSGELDRGNTDRFLLD
jgi:hypothetical protein